MIQSIENWAFDECFGLRGDRPTKAKIVIVAIDEQSLQRLDKPLMHISPELARIVNYLNDRGASTIAIDLLIPENLQGNDALMPGALGDVDVISRAAQQHKKVIFPELAARDGPSVKPLLELQIAAEANETPLGNVHLTIDPDLHLRRQQLRANKADGTHFSFPLVAFGASQNKPAQWFESPQLEGVDGLPIPIDSAGQLQVNFVGPPGKIPSIPFHDVLAAADGVRELDFDWSESVVLIGQMGPNQLDQFATPYATPSIFNLLSSSLRGRKPALMSGIEVHANVLATLIDGQYITTPWILSTPFLLAVFGALMGSVLARVSLELGAIITFVHHWCWKIVCALGLWYGHWRIEAVSMLILGMLVYGSVFALRWRWIRRTMGLFKSEAIARALEADPAKLDLRGEERVLSVLFCDIRNFTTFSENHTPQEVVSLLNAYFTAIIPIFDAHGGTVNQYIGDGMMVIFGAPEFQSDHARRAVSSAVSMLRRVDELQQRWRNLGGDSFQIGVGIHTGKAVVGTVGSPRRLDYTAIGDTVNTTARIEAANKELKTEILISDATFRQIPIADLLKLCRVGEGREIAVKGKQKVLTVYALSLDNCATSGSKHGTAAGVD